MGLEDFKSKLSELERIVNGKHDVRSFTGDERKLAYSILEALPRVRDYARVARSEPHKRNLSFGEAIG